MKCPSCGLFNPDSALICDCGHNFKDSRQKNFKIQVSENLLIDLIKVMSFFNPIAGLYLWTNHRASKNFTLKPAMIAIILMLIFGFARLLLVK